MGARGQAADVRRQMSEKQRFKNSIEDDILTEEDLHFIESGRKEYANGETIGHNDRAWK